MQIEITTLDKASAGSAELPDEIFAAQPRADIMARVVHWQLAKRRAGTHKVKGLSEVSGTTQEAVPAEGHRQCAPGQPACAAVPQRRRGARAGRARHEYSLNKKVRRLGLISALSQKQADGKLVVLDAAQRRGEDRRTGEEAEGARLDSVLIVDRAVDEGFLRASRNIPACDVLPTVGANVYDILQSRRAGDHRRRRRGPEAAAGMSATQTTTKMAKPVLSREAMYQIIRRR